MTRTDEAARALLGAWLALAAALGLAVWLLLGAVGAMHDGLDPTPPPTVLGTVHTAPTYEPEPAPMTPATAPGAVAVPFQP